MQDKLTELAKQAGLEFSAYSETTHEGVHIEAIQRFAELVRADALEDAAKACDEMHEHYTGLKDTALLNRDIELSNAMSGEPRACEFLATAIRGLMK